MVVTMRPMTKTAATKNSTSSKTMVRNGVSFSQASQRHSNSQIATPFSLDFALCSGGRSWRTDITDTQDLNSDHIPLLFVLGYACLDLLLTVVSPICMHLERIRESSVKYSTMHCIFDYRLTRLQT